VPPRDVLAADLKRKYNVDEMSIRDIADDIGRSYGFVDRILTEAGVKLRRPGGGRVRPAQSATADR
jgi:hypothetical protein